MSDQEENKCPVYPNCGSGQDKVAIMKMMDVLAGSFEDQRKELHGIQSNQKQYIDGQKAMNALLERVIVEEKTSISINVKLETISAMLQEHKADAKETFNNLGTLIRTLDSKKMDKAELMRYGVIFMATQTAVAGGIVWLLNIANVL